MRQADNTSRHLYQQLSEEAQDDMVELPGGLVIMGSTRFYPEEAPLRQAKVDAFKIDRFPVTNDQFSRFVAATGYKTLAEISPRAEDFPGADPDMLQAGSLVFHKPTRPVHPQDPSGWWRFAVGANWRQPLGPGSSLESLGSHPVVHVAYQDAEAYANWTGKALPTEAEWEYAARGGLIQSEFAWGDELAPGGAIMANYWHGRFPYENTLEDGFERTSPVGSFPANGYGLYDMIGNTWEWTCDWFVEASQQVINTIGKSCCVAPKAMRLATMSESYDPFMPQIRIPRRVMKGGSHLCAENYCQRYRPAARHPQMIDSSTSHLGFRCVKR